MWEENPIKLCCEPEQKIFLIDQFFAFGLGFFCLFFLSFTVRRGNYSPLPKPALLMRAPGEQRVKVLPSMSPLLALRHDAFFAYPWNSHGLSLQCGFLCFCGPSCESLLPAPPEGVTPGSSIRAPCACPSCHPGCNGCRSPFWALLLSPTLPHPPSWCFPSPQAELRSKDDTLSPGKDLLSVRKPSVGRTHSLPNDSYMFQPPYSSPCPPSLGDRKPAHHKFQSGTRPSAGTRVGFSNRKGVVVFQALR